MCVCEGLVHSDKWLLKQGGGERLIGENPEAASRCAGNLFVFALLLLLFQSANLTSLHSTRNVKLDKKVSPHHQTQPEKNYTRL